MRERHRNDGLRKICACPRRTWAKCPHGWHLNFKLRGGPAYRLSLDREVGRHLATKADAKAEADRLRGEIRGGTFRSRDARAADVAAAPAVPAPDEAASRLYEGGWPLLHVSEMLGHADLKTTQIYLNIAANGLHESMRKFEDAKQVADGKAAKDDQETSPGCKPVASEAHIEHPPAPNDEPRDILNVTVN